MVNMSGIPRPVDVRTNKRLREEEARKLKQQTSSRNTDRTTLGAGGLLELDGGGIDVRNGGSGRVRDGGIWSVEGGGVMEITGDGIAIVRGQSIDPVDGKIIAASAALEAREKTHAGGGLMRVPGVYFQSEYGDGGSLTAENGGSPLLASARKVPDPPGTPNRRGTYSRVQAADTAAIFGANSFDPDAAGAAQAKSYTSLVALPSALTFRLWDAAADMQAAIDISGTDPKWRFYSRGGMDVSGPFTVDGQPVTGGAAGGTKISHYVTTGSKGNAVVENQAVATLAYVSGGSTDNVATPGAGRLTINETGIYSIACTIRLYAEAALINPKPMTGRSFIDITDTAGDALARQAIPLAEDQATAPHPGVLLKAGDVVQFWLYQTSGGTAYYRARIWLTKNP